MTLYELATNVTVQGNIRISTFNENGEDEKILYEKKFVEELSVPWELAERVITYIFYGSDDFLHIEVE